MPKTLEQAARELLGVWDGGYSSSWLYDLKAAREALRAALSAETVSVPRDLVVGLTAVSTQPRYAGWVFVKHVDGEHWTTGAKLTPETWAMIAPLLAAAEKEPR